MADIIKSWGADENFCGRMTTQHGVSVFSAPLSVAATTGSWAAINNFLMPRIIKGTWRRRVQKKMNQPPIRHTFFIRRPLDGRSAGTQRHQVVRWFDVVVVALLQ